MTANSVQHPHTARSRMSGRAVVAALVPVAATAAVYSPQLFRDSDEPFAPAVTILWLLLLLAAAPVAAALFNRRNPVATNDLRAVLLGLPQIPAAVCLMRLDVWLEVRSGYLRAGSGEEAMSYGIGTMLAVVAGVILTFAVAQGARLGARAATKLPAAGADVR